MIKTIKYPVLDNNLCQDLHRVFAKWTRDVSSNNTYIQEIVKIIVDYSENIRAEGFTFYNNTFDFLETSYIKINTFSKGEIFEFEDGNKVSEVAACVELTGLEHRQVAELFQRCWGNLYVYKNHYVTVDYDEYYNNMEERVVGYPKLIFNQKVTVEDDSFNYLALDENGNPYNF